eukprot:COSAG01_NODE_1840_length_9078_cov_149.015481_7_plen_224_part_00
MLLLYCAEDGLWYGQQPSERLWVSTPHPVLSLSKGRSRPSARSSRNVCSNAAQSFASAWRQRKSADDAARIVCTNWQPNSPASSKGANAYAQAAAVSQLLYSITASAPPLALSCCAAAAVVGRTRRTTAALCAMQQQAAWAGWWDQPSLSHHNTTLPWPLIIVQVWPFVALATARRRTTTQHGNTAANETQLTAARRRPRPTPRRRALPLPCGHPCSSLGSSG